MKHKKLRKMKPNTRAWEAAANRLARDVIPNIYPCSECGGPVVRGYRCTRCGSENPEGK